MTITWYSCPDCGQKFFFNFLIDFIKLYIFLCSPLSLHLPFYSLSWFPTPPMYSGDLVFFYFPCRFDPYMSLLGSSLMAAFSGIMIVSWFYFALCLKATYDWVHMIFVFLGLGYLTQYGGQIFNITFTSKAKQISN